MVSGVKLQEVEMTEVILISFYTAPGHGLSFIENNCSDKLTWSWTQPPHHHTLVTPGTTGPVVQVLML